jgi:hypothetical protein
MTDNNDKSAIRLDISRMRPAEASKVVATRLWRTREGQRILITSDRELTFLLPVLAENGYTYERPREEDGVHKLRAVRK